MIERKVILYTTGCPKCKVLETKLKAKNVEYETCTDTEKMESLGIDTVPVLSVDEQLYNFSEAVNWVHNIFFEKKL